MSQPIIFGQSDDVTPQPYSFFGQPGWWTVPCGWYSRVNANGTQSTSPNQDFSNPVYDVKMNADGTLVFYDVMRNRMCGLG